MTTTSPVSPKNPKSRKVALPRGIYQREKGATTYFQVSLGTDASGKQQWKNVPTLDEAVTLRQLWSNAKIQQGESVWLLSMEQRSDAVTAFGMLKDHPTETLASAVRYYLDNHLALVRSENIAALVEKFIAEQTVASNRPATLIDLRSRLKPIKERFGSRLASEVAVDDVKLWLADMRKQGLAPMSIKHYLNKASSFFRWCVANRYAVRTPLDPVAVKRPTVVRAEVEFYSPDQADKILKTFAAHGLVSYAVLGLFCGIRPEETRRLRSKHFAIDGERIVITLGADVTKTGRRVIELERGTLIGDCVWSWLGGNGKLELPEKLAPALSTFKKKFKVLRGELGFDWINDGLRHTAATYHYSSGRDETATSALLGHTTPEMLRKHYKGLTTESVAAKFYALRPVSKIQPKTTKPRD